MTLLRSILIYSMFVAGGLVAADDPGGWSKAKWGMTDDEILKALDGQAIRFAQVDAYQHARVGIESIEIAGVRFKIYMSPGKDDKLDHVLFSVIDHSDETDQTFQSLESLLVQKYGRPWKIDEDTSETRLQWTFPTTVISLTRTVLPRLSGMPRSLIVSLIYQQRIDSPL